MTQRCALDLSEEWATLLVPQGRGWARLGRTPLAGDGLQNRLSALLRLGAGHLDTPLDALDLLVALPPDQMTYAALSMQEIGETAEDPTARLIAVLCAKHPHLTDAMALDWDLQGGWFLIAAAPRVVVEEATTFLQACGAAPSAFTARPEPGQFPDQPDLGGLRPPDGAQPWPPLPDPETAPGVTEQPVEPPVASVPSPPPVAALTPARIRADEVARRDPENLRTLDEIEAEDPPPRIKRAVAARSLRHRLTPGPRLRIAAALTLVLVAGLSVAALWPVDDMAKGPAPESPAQIIAAEPDEPIVAEIAADEDESGESITAAADPVEATRTADQPPPLPEDLTVFYSPAPILTQPLDEQDLLDLAMPGLDPSFRTDALALADLTTWRADSLPASPQPPGAAAQIFVVDDRGLVRPSADGTPTPDGVLVFEGQPPGEARPRPEREEPVAVTIVLTRAGLAEDHPLRNVAPRARPQGLDEKFERAALGGKTKTELALYRPVPRPASAQDAVRDAPATAQAVSQAPRPKARSPQAAQRFAAASVAKPAPQVIRQDQVETATAASPKKVAKQATRGSGIDLNEINLLGTFGSSRSPRALVRLASGRVVNVEVGDRIDGGKVSAIKEGRLSYVKGGRNVTLTMPRG
ncbi:hypothetical protein [Meridianimarinicoccus sp. MJW13]|uniref:hypothetical protein n=1 Tax=Meridianimarinicoccus sp. MJW13 TaxID=2720031 RepID=UPI0018660F1E|nr:hypothetical protein [Fluviibacterium sp. MJW13]